MRQSMVLLIASVAVGLAGPAHAQDYRRWQYAPRVSCATTETGVLLSFASQPVEWNVPDDAEFLLTYTENGIVQGTPDGPFPAENGVGSQIFGALAFSGDAYPFSASLRMDTLVDGEVTYRSAIEGSCQYDGPGNSGLVETVTWFRRWAFAPTATCSTIVGGVRVLLSAQPVEWVLPNDAQYTIGYLENGVLSVDGPFDAEGVGEGSHAYGGLANDFPSYPFDFDFRLDTLVDGGIVYRSTLSATCTADGSTPVALVDEAPEPGSAALGAAAIAAIALRARRRERP